MSNPYFTPNMSSNEIFYNQNVDLCLTDVVDGKAEADHTHTEYAASSHTHTGYASSSALAALETEVENKADIDHTHSNYATTGAVALLEHEVDGKAAATHTHTGYATTTALANLETEIDGKAASSHTHSYNDLTNTPTIPSAYTHPSSHPATMITGLADVATSGSYNDLSNKPVIPEAYTHPTSHPATMITGLSAVATSGSYNDLSNKPTIPEAYIHPSSHPASMITGLSDVATSGSYNDLSNKPTIPTIPSSLPANGGNSDTVDNKHASDFAAASHTHSEQMVMRGIVTSGDGTAYTATVPGVTALETGISFIMVPHVVSAAQMPTLNVNGLGAKNIRRRISNNTVTTTFATTTNWLYANKPVWVIFDGNYWIADFDIPNAVDLYGTLAIEKGGTGANTAASALTKLGAFPAAGGTISGDMDVTGSISANGVQAIYNSGTNMVLGSNSLNTIIGCADSGNITFNGARAYTGALVPKAASTYNIGNSNTRYAGIYLTAQPNVSSDERLKLDITALDSEQLADFVDKLNVVSYNYKFDDVDRKARIGLIAQEVQAADENIAKFFVEEDENGMLSMTPADLVFALIASVQELKKEIKELKSKEESK